MLNEQFSDRYKVIEVLDEGGLTRTLLARDHEQADYPLCIIKCVNESQDPEEIQQARWMLANEDRILRKLQRRTTNIPRWLDSSIGGDHPYLVGEYIEGKVVETLRQTNDSLSQSELVAFLHHALSVLDVVHRHNIVHQDIKPSNMIRRSDGTISLIDFGAAIQIDEDPEVVFGTHGYSPPEQQSGDISFANDLYALGICAIELTANVDPERIGRLPDGKIDWQALSVRLDPPIVAILDKLVHREPQERYSEALSVLSDLQRIEIHNRIVNRKPTERITRPIKRLVKRVRVPRIPALPTLPPKVGLVTSFAAISLISGFGLMPLAPRISDLITGQISDLYHEPTLTLARVQDISNQSVEQMVITANQQLITVGNNQIQRWNLTSGKVEQSWVTEPISAIALSQDGQRLAGRTQSGELKIWAVSTGALIKRFALPDPVASMSMSTDGKYLATISTTKTMRVWDTDTGSLIHTADTPVAAAAYSPTNQLICATGDYHIGIWSSNNEELQRMFFGHTDSVRALAISPDSNWLYSTGEDGTIVWRLDTGELVRVLPVRSDSTISAGLLANQFVAQNQDGAVHLWNHSGRLVRSVGDFDTPVTYSPDGKYVAVLTKNRHLQIWQVKGK